MDGWVSLLKFSLDTNLSAVEIITTGLRNMIYIREYQITTLNQTSLIVSRGPKMTAEQFATAMSINICEILSSNNGKNDELLGTIFVPIDWADKIKDVL